LPNFSANCWGLDGRVVLAWFSFRKEARTAAGAGPDTRAVHGAARGPKTLGTASQIAALAARAGLQGSRRDLSMGPMRTVPALLLAFGAAACTAPTRIVAVPTDTEVTLDALADALVDQDVVVLGEIHDNTATHIAHRQILAALHARCPDLIVSMEMFERDVQPVLDRYLAGELAEVDFLAQARPWSSYETDYRPVVEFARGRRLPVLAANLPRELAAKVAKEGPGAVAGHPHAAKATTAPKDAYWEAFQDEMHEHGGVGDASMERYYQAQCLKDDTMAESIVASLDAEHARNRRPMVVHICGRFHSDHRLGTVARLQARLPALKIAVVSAEESADTRLATYTAPKTIGDYVLVVPRADREPAPVKVASAAGASAAAKPAHGAAAAPAAELPAGHPVAGAAVEDMPARPALGLRPDYDFTGDGVLVQEVTPGGHAEAAGLVADDLIVALDGMTVSDMPSYVAALSRLHPGQEATVTVRRGNELKNLKCKVGERRM
jgi:uncharacterized iron-regulated protein